jgi:hypothetical protein
MFAYFFQDLGFQKIKPKSRTRRVFFEENEK